MSDTTPSCGTGYAGLRRPLLPYESAFSRLLFIASRNSLNAKEMLQIVSLKKRLSLFSGFANFTSWCNKSSIERNFGLFLPSEAESSFAAKMSSYCSTLMSNRLRICPICFQGSYHCFYYQFQDLIVCPIHGCKIESVCQSCGTDLSWYGLNHQLFDSPHRCVICRGTLSGAPISVDADDEFIGHAAEIARYFQQQEVVVSRLPVDNYRMISISATRPNHSLWCRPIDLRSEVSRDLGLPPVGGTGFHRSVEILRWRIQMKVCEVAKNDNVRLEIFSLTKTIWLVLQRRLERWIFGRNCKNKIDQLMAKIILLDEIVFFKDFDIKQLAYGLFRIQYGNDIYFRPNKSSDWAHLRRMPELGFHELWEGRLPRSALLNSLIGAFAGLYLTLLNRSHKSTYLDFRRLFVVDADFVSMSYGISKDGLCGGVVAFPSIAGLPVRYSKTR